MNRATKLIEVLLGEGASGEALLPSTWDYAKGDRIVSTDERLAQVQGVRVGIFRDVVTKELAGRLGFIDAAECLSVCRQMNPRFGPGHEVTVISWEALHFEETPAGSETPEGGVDPAQPGGDRSVSSQEELQERTQEADAEREE